MGSRSLILTIFACLLPVAGALGAACGGDSEPEPVPDEIVIEASEIEALTNYAFTTELEMSAPGMFGEGFAELEASFEGGFEAPDRLQGTIELTGDIAKALEQYFGRPRRTEMIVVPNEAWWREPGGEWQYGMEPYDSYDPFVLFATYATPRFFLEALQFNSLVVPLEGSLERVNGVDTVQVRLDRQGVMDLMPQGTGLTLWLGDEPSSGVSVDYADYWLPDDFLLEVWIAVDGHYPARIVISFTNDGEYPDLLDVDRVHLQMDITDPDAEFSIKVPEVGPE